MFTIILCLVGTPWYYRNPKFSRERENINTTLKFPYKTHLALINYVRDVAHTKSMTPPHPLAYIVPAFSIHTYHDWLNTHILYDFHREYINGAAMYYIWDMPPLTNLYKRWGFIKYIKHWVLRSFTFCLLQREKGAQIQVKKRDRVSKLKLMYFISIPTYCSLVFGLT